MAISAQAKNFSRSSAAPIGRLACPSARRTGCAFSTEPSHSRTVRKSAGENSGSLHIASGQRHDAHLAQQLLHVRLVHA